LTPQERLKKRMQAQLSKQFKMDKKVQREKEEQKEVERIVGCRLLSRIASLVLQFCSSFHFFTSLHTRN